MLPYSISNDGVFRRKRQKDANGLFEGQQNSLIVQDAWSNSEESNADEKGKLEGMMAKQGFKNMLKFDLRWL
jgi:hypothetical protein